MDKMIGKRICQARKARQLTQEDLSISAGYLSAQSVVLRQAEIQLR